MPGKPTCLAKALATQALMQWQSFDSELKIGVRKSENGGFSAHAWVEQDGHIIIGNLADLDEFIPLLEVAALNTSFSGYF